MHRIDGPGATLDGKFREGDPAVDTASTWVTADWTNAIQEELAHLVEAAGLTLNKGDNTQLLQAIGVMTSSLSAQLQAAINAAYRKAAPIGTVWEGYALDAPPGMLRLNGGVYSRSGYAELWAWAQARGLVVPEASWAANWTFFSTGDGGTTFRLPSLEDEFIRGVPAGRSVGSWQDSDNKSHTHGVDDPGHGHGYTANPVNVPGGAEGGSRESNGPQGAVTGVAATSISIQSSGGAESRPRNVALLRCIVY